MESVTLERKTRETEISVSLRIDGSGRADIDTGVPFFDHMLTQIAVHGFFDLDLKARGDLEVDYHHTVEDCGILLGQAFARALGDKKGLKRYGFASIPLNEALSSVTIDLSGRPYLSFRGGDDLKGKVGDFDAELVEEFLFAFASNSGSTLHVTVESGTNMHHIAETVFKALARALDAATMPEPRASGAVSSKGTL